MDLTQFFQAYPKVALGLSGGVDSSYLLCAARQSGAQVLAYFIKSAFQPRFELEDARRVAGETGAALTVLECDILAVPAVAENSPRRCYHCKTALFGMLRSRAMADGCSVLIDGTNASDDAGDRPGMQALAEMEVLSPLRLCGIAKEEVRRLSREAGLFTWNKPSYACLATRVPTGTPLTAEALQRVERAEDALFALGFSDFRVRLAGETARIQLPDTQLPRAVELRGEIQKRFSQDFTDIVLDLKARGM